MGGHRKDAGSGRGMVVSKRGKGKYWLVKCEFDECSFDELKQRPQSTGYWRGVRNYQARNLIRDNMEEGDLGVLSITPTATSRGSLESR